MLQDLGALQRTGIFFLQAGQKNYFGGSPSHVFHRKQPSPEKNNLLCTFWAFPPVFKQIFGLLWLGAFLPLGREIKLGQVMRCGLEIKGKPGRFYTEGVETFAVLVGCRVCGVQMPSSGTGRGVGNGVVGGFGGVCGGLSKAEGPVGGHWGHLAQLPALQLESICGQPLEGNSNS